MRKTLTHRLAAAVTAGALLMPLAAAALTPVPWLTSVKAVKTATAPTIDGTIGATEWRGLAVPVTFRLPGTTVTGTLQTMWDADHLYLAVTTRDSIADAGDRELDIAIDEDGDGRLETGDPAYLAWTNGRRQGFHYEHARRGFVLDRRERDADFAHATRRDGGDVTFEVSIPRDPRDWEDLDRALGINTWFRLALKYERAGVPGQYDTWPTPSVRDPLNRQPQHWALVTLGGDFADDRIAPRVELTINPDKPTPTQTVGWQAKAFDGFGLDRIELWENDRLVKTCTATTICEHSTGPYAAGTVIRAEARAHDRNGNTSTAAWRFTVATPPVQDTIPPGAPLLIQAVNPGTGTTAYLFWVNPTDADFAKVRIYRSVVAGTLGTLIATDVTAPYVDRNLTEGTSYFYTIRAVDKVGNESTNTGQVSVAPRRP